MNNRASGIIIHPTSFPGPYGCGDLGDGAKQVIDWLKKSGQKILQVLPLGPTGYGDSPYQSFSSFAGTPYIISLDILYKKGYLTKADLDNYPKTGKNRVDYGSQYIHKFKILKLAYKNAKQKGFPNDFATFCKDNINWLDDYSAFMALKDKNQGKSWDQWGTELKNHKINEKTASEIKDDVEFYKFIQWKFFEQWKEFKNYAHNNGIKIVGDIPIFVSYDSADVWGNQQLFLLNKDGSPKVVSGVPPDYFSKTGQLWGNPIYNWELMKSNGFEWWKERIRKVLDLVDCIRIDHFRGFEGYWEIPFGEKTAVKGKWVKAPGTELFNSFEIEFGKDLPKLIIAEDLGVITDEVREIRDHFGLPGMRIFEFASFPSTDKDCDQKEHIDDFCEDDYLPDYYIPNCVAYPGSHDNDTLLGWISSLSKQKQKDIFKYLNIKEKSQLNEGVIRSLLDSKANRVIFLIQDILKLPSENRMNLPGTCGTHNWSWRLTEEMLNDKIAVDLYKMVKNSRRL